MSFIGSYQEEKSLQTEKAVSSCIATVGTVSAAGLTLIFDGETAESKKRYKYNSTVTFQAGQRVYVVKIAGTYLVVCPISI